MVRRSKGSSLIINLDMVKEEDKGRGYGAPFYESGAFPIVIYNVEP
jgi:hypothetical protein